MEPASRNLNIMSQARNYNAWIYSNIRPYLGERILEVGCGTGNMTESFLNQEKVVGIDISDDHLNLIKLRFSGRSNFEAFNYDICDDKVVELRGYRFDTIICINVLEHIEDDIKAIKNMYQLLRENGRLILLVPAFKSLYGTIDEANHHFRRYSKSQLKDKLKECGFATERTFYMNILGICVWVLHGKLLRKTIHPQRQISLLDKFVFLGVSLERVIKLPLGLSLICIGLKK